MADILGTKTLDFLVNVVSHPSRICRVVVDFDCRRANTFHDVPVVGFAEKGFDSKNESVLLCDRSEVFEFLDNDLDTFGIVVDVAFAKERQQDNVRRDFSGKLFVLKRNGFFFEFDHRVETVTDQLVGFFDLRQWNFI